jgi:tetratricopeptide (TPR) repeat protein
VLQVIAEHTFELWFELSQVLPSLTLILMQNGLHNSVILLTNPDILEQLNIRGLWKEYWSMLTIGFEAAQIMDNRLTCIDLGFRLVRKSQQVRKPTVGQEVLSKLEMWIDVGKRDKYAAQLWSHKALVAQMNGDLPIARSDLLKSRRIYGELPEPTEVAVINLLLGQLERLDNRLDAAKEAFNCCLRILRDRGPSKFFAEAQIGLAHCIFQERDFHSSEKILIRALSYCAKHNFKAVAAKAHHILALVLSRTDRINESIVHAEAAIRNAAIDDNRLRIISTMLLERLKHKR